MPRVPLAPKCGLASIAALRTDDYFRERAGRANIAKTKRILKRAGRGKAAVPGDEI